LISQRDTHISPYFSDLIVDLLRREIETVGKDVTTSQMDFNVKEKEYLRARELLAKNKKRKGE
jgi:hypothetical protein